VAAPAPPATNNKSAVKAAVFFLPEVSPNPFAEPAPRVEFKGITKSP
jgi:hypothetical protein